MGLYILHERQTCIQELQIINQSLRENEKVKEDALPHLSDQLFVMNEKIEQLLFICLV
jgi:hypothetical protein